MNREDKANSFPRPGWPTIDSVTYTNYAPPTPDEDPEDLPFQPLPETKQ